MMTLANVQRIKKAVVERVAWLWRIFNGESLFRRSRNMPNDILRIRMKAIMTTSRAMTTIEAGKREVSTTHVGVNLGRANPTRIPPATSRMSKTPWTRKATRDTFAPSVNFQSSYYMSIPYNHSRCLEIFV